jgi:ABC-type amino acid transport system permease subunit
MDDSTQANPSKQSFSQPLRAALWGSPLVMIGAWMAQWLWRFPPRSVGASLTAKALALGALLASISALCATYRLVRTRPLRTVEGYVLTCVNTIPLLFAVIVVVSLALRK